QILRSFYQPSCNPPSSLGFVWVFYCKCCNKSEEKVICNFIFNYCLVMTDGNFARHELAQKDNVLIGAGSGYVVMEIVTSDLQGELS
ncbi:TPA: hypothetical protein ACSPZV_004220, partial [Aeromonas veronii]